MKRTSLFEAYIKHIQNVSDFDKFLEQFDNIEIIELEDFDEGLLKYDSIPYDTAYIFAYPS